MRKRPFRAEWPAGRPGGRSDAATGADRRSILHGSDGTPELIDGRQVGPERPTYRRAWVSSRSSSVPPTRDRPRQVDRPRLKGSGRGPTPPAVRGKTPPGNARFGVMNRHTDARGTKTGRGRQAAPAPGGIGRLFGSLAGRH